MTKSKTTILLVDDDRLILGTLKAGLEHKEYNVHCAGSAAEALTLLTNIEPDIAILDIRMTEESGISLARKIRGRWGLPVIFLTAYDDKELIEQAVSSGAYSYLVKPVSTSQLIPVIETALYRANELAEANGQKDGLKKTLERDRNISIATGILMERRAIGSDEAFDLLRKFSRDNSKKIVEVAETVTTSMNLVNSIGNG